MLWSKHYLHPYDPTTFGSNTDVGSNTDNPTTNTLGLANNTSDWVHNIKIEPVQGPCENDVVRPEVVLSSLENKVWSCNIVFKDGDTSSPKLLGEIKKWKDKIWMSTFIDPNLWSYQHGDKIYIVCCSLSSLEQNWEKIDKNCWYCIEMQYDTEKNEYVVQKIERIYPHSDPNKLPTLRSVQILWYNTTENKPIYWMVLYDMNDVNNLKFYGFTPYYRMIWEQKIPIYQYPDIRFIKRSFSWSMYYTFQNDFDNTQWIKIGSKVSDPQSLDNQHSLDSVPDTIWNQEINMTGLIIWKNCAYLVTYSSEKKINLITYTIEKTDSGTIYHKEQNKSIEIERQENNSRISVFEYDQQLYYLEFGNWTISINKVHSSSKIEIPNDIVSTLANTINKAQVICVQNDNDTIKIVLAWDPFNTRTRCITISKEFFLNVFSKPSDTPNNPEIIKLKEKL